MIYTAGWNAGRGGGWKDFLHHWQAGDSVLGISPDIRSFSSTASLYYGLVIEKSAAAGDQSKAGARLQ